MKKVYVEVEGKITADGSTDCVNYSTEGSLYKKSGKYYIHYTEGSLTVGKDCRTTVKVNPEGVVTLMRSGEVNTQMTFERGKCHISCYETVGGNITVSVTTGDLLIDMNDNGGRVEMDYRLSINNAANSRNHVSIRVRE